MTPPQITTIEKLHEYLYHAMQLEHGTIPVYLTALYSLHPGSNSDAHHIIRTVAVEEMLHLSLVANVMNAVGGTPDLTQPDFVPPFPAYLPDGETDFQVDLQPFSQDAVTTFLNIERPDQAPDEDSRLRQRSRPQRQLLAGGPEEFMMQFYSIGDFYEEIARGVRYLHQQYEKDGRQLFTGDPSRQVTPEYFYSGGGELTAVTDLDSALAAFRLIAEQGEGYGGGIYDNENRAEPLLPVPAAPDRTVLPEGRPAGSSHRSTAGHRLGCGLPGDEERPPSGLPGGIGTVRRRQEVQ